MIVYLFSPDTFEYIAPPYTVPKGAFDDDLVPTYCAMDAPPAFDPATQTCRWNGEAWVVADIPPPQPEPDPDPAPEPTPEEKWRAYVTSARTAFDRSNALAVECMKRGMAYPTAWLTYSDALKAIILAPSGNPSTPLPTEPAMPQGVTLLV